MRILSEPGDLAKGSAPAAQAEPEDLRKVVGASMAGTVVAIVFVVIVVAGLGSLLGAFIAARMGLAADLAVAGE
ncbi:MAG TPA: hypothetical protein PK400_00940, partial [Phycisphaerales bacterium]|nr:hypothetical protein [Phycisphaerales bacterium]